MGGLNRQDGSPCSIDSAAIKAPLTLSVAIDHTSFSLLFATLISDFRQHGRARGEGRNAIRLKTDQRNLEVQKGMMCWKDGREGGPRSDQSDRVTVQNTLHYAPTGGRDQIVNIRTCPTNLGFPIFILDDKMNCT